MLDPCRTPASSSATGDTTALPATTPRPLVGTDACTPSSRSRKIPIPHDQTFYRRRHRTENLFARLKDWRRIATRYDRCAHTFMAAVTIAAIMIFWINES